MVEEPVERVGRVIRNHLAEIAPLFKPGTKLTLVVRHPSYPSGSRDMVVTDDSLDDVIKALEIRKASE